MRKTPIKPSTKGMWTAILYAALQYVSNDRKTDERMHVSGINCNAKRAYERMTATKKRFGKTGGQCGVSRVSELSDRRNNSRRSA